MKQLRLYGMSRAFNTTLDSTIDYTSDELIAYLINSEYDDRENRKVARLINTAKFRYKVFMEEIDFDSSREIDKNLINRLEFCDFIKNKENILVCGGTGVGKSFKATTIDYKACMTGYKVNVF